MKNSLRVERARIRISQKDLAEKVDVTRLTIHSIENEKKTPSVELAMKIARVFKKNVEEIFFL